MKHSALPWNYDERPGIVAVYAGEKRDCLDMPFDCFLYVRHFSKSDVGWVIDEQACADAKLISASPVMLETLKKTEKYLIADMEYRKSIGWPPSAEAKEILKGVQDAVVVATGANPGQWIEKLVVGVRIRMGFTTATITHSPEPGFFHYTTDLGNKGYFDMSGWKLPQGDPSSPVEILSEKKEGVRNV